MNRTPAGDRDAFRVAAGYCCEARSRVPATNRTVTDDRSRPTTPGCVEVGNQGEARVVAQGYGSCP